MANPQHIEWLLEGPKAWNARRKCEQFIPDLEGADVREAFLKTKGLGLTEFLPLKGIDLSSAKLKGANLHKANLKKAVFLLSDLQGADLSWSDLKGANLIRAQLEGTKIYGSVLINANLAKTEPWNAVLYRPPDDATIRRVPASGIESSIKDISSLVNECNKIRKHYKRQTAEEISLYFRGERNGLWDLTPSVRRTPAGEFTEGELLRSKEGEMLVDLISRWPEAFNNQNSAIEHWVLAQHHGLKTRLIDITRNPLVALFYACDDFRKNGCEKDNAKNGAGENDGRLHVFAVPRSLIKPFNSDTVSVIANFARLSWAEQELLLGAEVSLGQELDYSGTMRRLYHFIRHEKPYFQKRINPMDLFNVFVVEPQRLFERIRSQSGAFLISAFHDRFERREILNQNSGLPVYDHYTLTVPGSKRQSIVDELRMLNVTRETLFPGLDEAAKAVIQRHSK